MQYHHALISDREGYLDLLISTTDGKYLNATNDKFVDYGIEWSPEGKHIIFAKQVNGQYDLYLYDVELMTTKQITNDTIDQYGPSFAPNGRDILFVSNRDQKLAEIYLMNLKTGKTTRITSNDRLDGSPTFHPDGVTIFYTSFMERDSLNRITNSEIFVTDTTGSHHTRLTNRIGNDGALDVSPDGKRIACHYFLNGKADIYTLDINGADMKRLTADSLDNRWPRWTPDGKYLAFTRVGSSSDIWIMGRNGGKMRPFVTSPKRDEILEFKPATKSMKD